MKRILLVNKSFEVGGIESSMVNMANELSHHYQVDLFIYNPEGVLKSRLNDVVNIIKPSWRFRALGMTVKDAFKTHNLKIMAFRSFSMLWSKMFSNKLPIAIAIKHQKKLTGYDLAIAYHQEQRKKASVSGFVRMVDQCVQAKVKAAWLHFDSASLDLDSAYNNPFYQKMDKLVCVSKALADGFAGKYPALSHKVDYCHNFLPFDEIIEKSKQPQDVSYPAEKFVCFSACRLVKVKAIVRAVQAMADVFKQYSDVVWYIAGDGPERENIEAAIEKHGLQEQIVLLGTKSNPYPYMRNAGLVLNTSFQEAAPMVFLESKALGTPVFATKTASTEELLQNGVDSFICENSEQGIRTTFAELMQDRAKVAAASDALKSYNAGNDASLLKVKSFME